MLLWGVLFLQQGAGQFLSLKDTFSLVYLLAEYQKSEGAGPILPPPEMMGPKHTYVQGQSKTAFATPGAGSRFGSL